MPGFQQFIRERQYISNVSPATVDWYDAARWAEEIMKAIDERWSPG